MRYNSVTDKQVLFHFMIRLNLLPKSHLQLRRQTFPLLSFFFIILFSHRWNNPDDESPHMCSASQVLALSVQDSRPIHQTQQPAKTSKQAIRDNEVLFMVRSNSSQ